MHCGYVRRNAKVSVFTTMRSKFVELIIITRPPRSVTFQLFLNIVILVADDDGRQYAMQTTNKT
jgi:hypothetical protein